jgi:CubicO group peptidase (beta-lactamase class C family)
MKKYPLFLTSLISTLLLLVIGNSCQFETTLSQQYPEEEWMQYANLTNAGWDENLLDSAVKFADSINTAAFMLIEDGVIVKSYGEINRRFMCHSVRKSFISALYGIYVEKQLIDTSKTIKDLGIDDIGKLTEAEKKAKIIHLLKSKSGIFHPAAYETPFMASSRPKRGSHSPGTFWNYNNWDFNTLGHIFTLETGEDIFEAFNEQIAKPLMMQDFETNHCYYHLEPEHSKFPAYPFRMSARDMARFGLLFERKGKWNGKQIISEEWIEKSTTPYSTELGDYSGSGYGFMWWLLEKEFDEYGGGYSALGVGEQTITVLPNKNIVFVHRTNTYQNTRVSRNNTTKLLKSLLKAKISSPDSSPKLEEHILPANPIKDYKNYRNHMALVGQYEFLSGIRFEIKKTKNGLRLIDDRMGNYNLIFTSDTSFLLEDRLEPFYIIRKNNKPTLISERIINREGYFLLNSNRIDEALDILKINTLHYPQSFNVFDSMGEVLLIAGDTINAIENYKKSIKLNPNNTRAIWLLMELNVEGYHKINMDSDEISIFSGEYTFGNQTLRLQAKGKNLYIITQRGQNEILLIPIAKNQFIVSRGNHDIFDFSISSKNNEFNIITRNGVIGKWRKNLEL